MNIILIVSILIRLCATACSIVMILRIKDWRMAFITLMLLLMTTRQILAFFATSGFSAEFALGSLTELPGLLVSVLAFLSVFFLASLLKDREKLALERNRLERENLQSQKIESIGRLTGGIAHDLNNLLTPILINCEILQKGIEQTHKNNKQVEQIFKVTNLAKDLVQRLMAFSRNQPIKRTTIELNETILAFEQLIHRTVREDIGLEFELHHDPVFINADLGQIEQVILNLIINAQEAMQNAGRIVVSTSTESIDEPKDGLAPGDFVVLSVRDFGCGMTPDIMDQIFEPFFSTKGEMGNGLGLAMVYGIVKQHGGKINVISAPNEGTSFSIWIPASEGVAEKPTGQTTSEEKFRGNETVLLVEDNERVRVLADKMLTEFGYKVLSAENGAKAMSILKDNKIDLLVTDVVMPEMNGNDLFRELKSVIPDIKTLFISGYVGNKVDSEVANEKNVHFISKPFTGRTLGEKIRQILDQ